MRKVTCTGCASDAIALNESIHVDTIPYCVPCFESSFPTKEALGDKKAVRTVDPTICSFCQSDFEETELPKISHYPICDPCALNLKNKTFPKWVKGFLIGIAAIVVFSFCWNWKYYRAYTDFNDGLAMANRGDFHQGAKLLYAAGIAVPEVEDLRTIANYYEGLALLKNDQSEKALPLFNQCKGKLPDNYHVAELLLHAQIGVAFDHKDYEGFLKGSQECLALDSTQVTNWQQMASAYSCLYAIKGDENNKLKTYQYLARAKQMDSTTADSKLYYNMIDYRLTTHQAITRNEFTKQYPHGWTKP